MNDIKNYEGLYKVTEDGQVWSVRKSKYLAAVTVKDGVQKVALYKDGQKKNKSIHRLVAEEYVPNVEGKPQVDHIDGDKTNNHKDNLRWCTNEENQAFRDEQLNSGKGHGGANPIGKQVKWGTATYPSIGSLARHIAKQRGSQVDTVKKEIKAVRYGGKTLYGEWCELV